MKLILSILALLYVVSPYDLFPDFFIGWGWIDDLIVLCLLWWYFSFLKKTRGGSHFGASRGASSFQGMGGNGSHKEESFGTGSPPHREEGRKDPWTVLGVPKDASQEKIKQAYRQLANRYHPDKVSHLGDEFRNLAERRFKEIQEAYEHLRTR
jgi:hypothetical protein